MPAVTPTAYFDAPADPDATIWRYLDLAKFVSMLETESLHFARSDQLGDPFEGSVTAALRAQRSSPESTWLTKIFGEHVAERYEGARGFVFLNCWNLSKGESAALWPLYVPSNQGVAIRSTYGRLIASFQRKEPDNLHVGLVRYIDYSTESFPPLPAPETEYFLRAPDLVCEGIGLVM